MRSSAATRFDWVANHRGSSKIMTSAASVTAPSPATRGVTFARWDGCGSTRIVVQRGWCTYCFRPGSVADDFTNCARTMYQPGESPRSVALNGAGAGVVTAARNAAGVADTWPEDDMYTHPRLASLSDVSER